MGDNSPPSTPPAPAPAPAAPGRLAVTSVDSDVYDDDDRGPKTFSNVTGQSTVPETTPGRNDGVLASPQGSKG